ncbi:DsbA family oxidoreductase [Oxalobacteraceae bacterium CAVE-383]|nr:DsbA family oxidoreductase [Oxalobacteraceae bacterium CAVE-383]
MTTAMKIDFVSDVSCPWCVVGLRALQEAIAQIGDDVRVDLHFQPFELNPQMADGGQDIVEHISEKYGSSPAQIAANGEAIRARGAALGFTFNMDKRNRIYNTFDAHRLLHWAELEGKQLALKTALFEAYFTDGLNPSDHTVLVAMALKAGLDADQARKVLESGAYADEVRAQEQFYQGQGIRAVPAIIINDRHLISGGQPVEVFEQALRQIADTETV